MRSILALLACATVISSSAYAGTPPVQPKTQETLKLKDGADLIRVGGDYTVGGITRRDNGTFVVEFRSDQPTGKFDVLKLESDHVHVAVKVGQKLRLSAEILQTPGQGIGATAEVSQVVLFLPNPAGRVPVWLLSNKVPAGELRGVKYLEMHSPSNDYIIM